MIFLLSSDFFSKLTFSKNAFNNHMILSNSLNPDQARRLVRPDLGSWLQKKQPRSRHQVATSKGKLKMDFENYKDMSNFLKNSI